MILKKINTTSETLRNSVFANPIFLTILIISVFVYTSIIMVMVSLPKFAETLGASSQQIGLLSGIFAMGAFLMRPFSGQIVDKGNQPTIIRIIFTVLLISAIGLTQATQYWMLLVFWIMSGLAWGVGSTLFMTIATGCFDSENMTSGIGVYSVGLTLALTIAPLIALPFAEKYSYNQLYYINVMLLLISFGLSFFLKIEYTPPADKKISFNLNNILHTPAILPTTVTMVNTITRASITAFLVIFADTLGIANVAIYFTIRAIMLFAFRPAIGKFTNRFGARTVLIFCEISTVMAMVLISQAQSLVFFIAAGVLVGLGEAGHQPILLAECISTADESRRGTASNTNFIGIDIGNFVGSNLAGVLVASVGYRNMYLLAALPVIIATSIYTTIKTRKK